VRARHNWDGDEFDAVVRAHRSSVFRFVLSRLRDRDAAEIVTQDCFLKAWATRARFRKECSTHTWLMQIAINLVRDRERNRRIAFWNRAQGLERSSEQAAGGSGARQCSPECRVLRREQLDAVWRAAGRLSKRQHTVFVLRFAKEMDVLEIAAVTGMKEGTVKTHLFRALRAVREQLRSA
jgi:RNA polymerase sigma-70 factor (ECF subfamily)